MAIGIAVKPLKVDGVRRPVVADQVRLEGIAGDAQVDSRVRRVRYHGAVS